MNQLHSLNKTLLNKRTKIWCEGARFYSETIKQKLNEQVNPKTENLVQFIESDCSNCG